MTDIDDKILSAIRAEAESTLGDYDKELGLFGLVGETFKGALRWVVITAFALILIFIALGIYCAVHFLNAAEIASKLNWMAGSGLCFLIVVALRIWYFTELGRVSIRREVKRVELQVALLGAKLDKQMDSST